MSDFYRQSVSRKARKAHICSYCAERIDKGSVYTEQTGVWDSKAFRHHFHDECFEELCEHGDGTFTPFSNERPKANK